jgi:25S rRNA (cytosine2870-C5)-methyltransferase
MRNTGLLIANDINKERLTSLVFNIQRMAVTNVIVTNYDGKHIGKVVGKCDRVLLDAPCSGLGVIARDPSIKSTKVN